MHVYDAACLRVMREVADEHGLVLVFDEIATGFGRTGHAVRRRGRRRRARHHVRRQGADRRLPDARRGAVHRRGGPRPLRVGVRRAHARADLHGQPARLRGRAAPTSTCWPPADWQDQVARIGAGLRRGLDRCRGAAARGRRAHPRRRRRGPARPPGRRRQGHRGRARRRACGCGRSATSSTRCRRTSAPTTTSPGSARRSRPRRWSDERRWQDVAGASRRRARERRRAAARSLRAARRRRRRSSTWPATTTSAWPGTRGRRGRRRGGAARGEPARAPRGWSPARSTLHAELERELAAFLGQPAALVLSTGYHANLAAVAALADRDSADRLRRPRPRLAGRRRPAQPRPSVAIVPHNDVGGGRVARWPRAGGRRALVLVESVYSVLGDAAPLAELAGGVRDVRRAAGRRRGARPRRRRRRRGRPRARARAGRPTRRRRHRDALEGARQPGRCGARRPGARRPPGQPRAAVHLRHRPGAGRRRRRAGRAAACSRDEPELPALGHATRVRALAAALGVAPPPAPCCRCRCPRRRSALARAGGRARRGRAGRLLPAAVGARRHLAAADHRRAPASPDAELGAGRRTSSCAVVKEYGRAMSVVVVTGTGTGVGKTVATAALAVRAAATGTVVVVKPVQTGVGGGVRRAGRRRRRAPADRLRGPGVHRTRRPAGAGHRRPAARGARSRRWPSTPTGSRCWPSSTTRCSSRAPAGCWSGSTPTAAPCSTSPSSLRGRRVVVVVAAGLGTLNHTELTVDALRARGASSPPAWWSASWPAEPGTGGALQPRRTCRASPAYPCSPSSPQGAGVAGTRRVPHGCAVGGSSASGRRLVEEPPVPERVGEHRDPPGRWAVLGAAGHRRRRRRSPARRPRRSRRR